MYTKMWPSGWSTSSPQPGQQQQQQPGIPNNLYAAAYGASAQQAHGGSPMFGQQAAFMPQQGAYGYGAPAVPAMAPPLSQENIFSNIMISLEQRKQQALLDLARACSADAGLYPSYNVGTQPQAAAGQNWTKEQQNPISPYFPQNPASAQGTPNSQDVHHNANNGSFSSRVGSEQTKECYTNNRSASSADHQTNTHYQTYQQGHLSERHETSEKVADKGTPSSRMVQEPIENTNKDASQDMNDDTIMSGIDSIVVFQISQLRQITNGYSNILGKGSFGEVYLGTLNDGRKVAVKVPMRAAETDKNDFKNELRVQSRIKHKNVVKLLGYCLEGGTPKLVYEFAAHGNLYDKLHGNCRMPMLLGDCLRILVECAEALAYIHSSTDTRILHGDVKSANILLDANYSAKVSDFGLSRLLSMGSNTMHTKNVIGSIGYIDPLFMDTGILTQLSEVYSFGVVMVEIITRRKTCDELGKSNNLASCFQSCMAKGKRAVHGMVDKEIATRNNKPVLEEIAKLALDCLSTDMKKRPEMKKVAHRLSLLIEPRFVK